MVFLMSMINWNSLFVASWVTFLQVLTSAMAAYAFSRLSWPGRDKVFLLYLATMMLPGIVLMIPVYNLMIQFGLLFFDSSRGQATHLLMAAVALTIIPMIAAFLFLQKQMISGIQLGAVKG